MQVIVLSDGKPGHYNQSLGLAEKIENSDYRMIEVQFRGKIEDNLLRAFFRLFGGIPLTKLLNELLLKFTLTQNTIDLILSIGKADLIISAGSSVAQVNLILGRLLEAKSVTCDRPSPIGVKHFDLAILPRTKWRHRQRSNVCRTIGLLNRIDPEKLNGQRSELEAKLELPKIVRIGVLVGGIDRHHTIGIDTAKKLREILQKLAEQIPCQIMMTTSRRTPIEVEKVLEQFLAKSSFCNAIFTILSVSDLLVVTEDSFAMVGEAVSSQKPVLILKVDRRTKGSPKQYLVYDEMMRQKLVRWAECSELERNVKSALGSKKKPIDVFSNDMELAISRVNNLFSR